MTDADGFAYDVSVVLPTYNEHDTIVEVVRGALENLRADGYDAEVIVVDDDSPDGTGGLVRACFGDNHRVRLIRRTQASGLSSAVLRGLRASTGRYGVVMDADGQHPPERLPALVGVLSGRPPDVVVGSRHVTGGSIEGWPHRRKVVSAVAATIARACVPAARRVTDPMSGFFALDRRRFDDEMLGRCDPHGYKILLELLTHGPGDLEVDEVPITFRERQAGQSKLDLDEQLRFVEHVATLGLVATGAADRVVAPQLIRAIELGAVVGVSLLLIFVGIWLGDVDGAGGAGLIAVGGGAITLAALRFRATGERWSDDARQEPGDRSGDGATSSAVTRGEAP